MTLAPWKMIAIMGLVPVAGIGIAYPIVSNYKNKSQIELKTLSDFKNNCFVVASQTSSNQKLIACPVTKNSSDTDFYLYENNSQLPKKITGGNVENQRATFTLEGFSSNQTFQWDSSQLSVLGINSLLKECKIDWQAPEGQKTLTCSNKELSKNLEKFQ